MFARGVAPRFGLRAFLLACAVTLGSFANAYADSVNLTFTGVTQWNGVTGVTNSVNNGGGQFNWNINSKTGPLATTLFPTGVTKAATFCIETVQYTGSGVNYDIYTSIDTLPIPAGAMGASKAQKIQALGSLMTFNTNFAGLFSAPTVQAAIWHILATNTLSGYATNNGDIVATNVNALLGAITTELARIAGGGTVTSHFYGLSSGSNQDQIVLVDNSGHSTTPAPVPAGVVLAGMGIACMGGFNFLRRRKAVAAL